MNTFVYAFEWCSCIYESGYDVVSLHATKTGAFKAMVKGANKQWYEARLQALQVGKDKMDPLIFNAWRIKKYSLHA